MDKWERGSIVMVTFSQTNKRPCVILSASALNEVLETLIVAPLTTNVVPDAWPLRLNLSPRGSMPKPTDVMLELFYTVNKEMVDPSVIATLSAVELTMISSQVKKIFSL